MSKITLVNNGEVTQSIQNHMGARLDVPAGETVVINLDPAKDITTQAFLKKFYAQYDEILEATYDIADYPLDLEKVDVTFNVDGGSAVPKQTIYVGTKATKPADPTKEESTFGGWFADAAKTTEFDFDAPIFEATTVYAKWSAASNSGKSNTPGIDVVSAAPETTKVTSKTAKKASK